MVARKVTASRFKLPKRLWPSKRRPVGVGTMQGPADPFSHNEWALAQAMAKMTREINSRYYAVNFDGYTCSGGAPKREGLSAWLPRVKKS